MKQLRIIIIAFIVIAAGAFLFFTAGTDAESLLFERILVSEAHTVTLVLLIAAFILLSTLTGLPVFYLGMALGFLIKHEAILLSVPETRTWKALLIGGFILLFTLIFIVLRISQHRKRKLRSLDVIPYKG